jgi:uncharacterized protein YukE
VSRPVDWAPLRSSDPTPGDPEGIGALARRYQDTAQSIADQAARLRRLSSGTSGQWTGKAAEVFRSHAGDLADRITKAQGRYEAAGNALARWSTDITGPQDRADAALRQAQEAQRALASTQPGPPPPAGAPDPTPDQVAAERSRQQAHQQAADDLSAAHRQVEDAQSDYEHAAGRVADAIHDAVQHDGVHDSWWDRNFHWVKDVVKWINVAVTVLAIAALVIGLFIPGLDVLIGAYLLYAIAAGTVLMLAGDSALAATGKGSWTSAALDAVGLLTLGIGGSVARLGGRAADIAGSVAAGRAGRAVMSARGMPGMLYSLASRSSTVSGLVRVFPKVATALDDAGAAAGVARSGVTALRAETSLVGRALVGGNRELAETSALVSRLDRVVPGVLRLQALNGLVKAGGYTAGAGTYGVLGYGADVVAKDLVIEPAADAATEQDIAATSDRYSCPTVPLP